MFIFIHIDLVYSFLTTIYILHILCIHFPVFGHSGFCLFLFGLVLVFWFYKQGFLVNIFMYVSLYTHAWISLGPVLRATVSGQDEFLLSAFVDDVKLPSKETLLIYLSPLEYRCTCFPVIINACVDGLKHFCCSDRCEMVSCNYLSFHVTDFQGAQNAFILLAFVSSVTCLFKPAAQISGDLFVFFLLNIEIGSVFFFFFLMLC